MYLLPMFDPRSSILGLPASVAIMLGAIGCAVIGFLWMRHMMEPGPLLKGESQWRYRSRPRLERIRQWLAEGDQSIRARTRGWWVTRIEFVVAGAALGLATILLPGAATSSAFGGSTVPPLAASAVGYAGILFGIWWMRRLYLSPLRDAEPRHPWRYRDR